MWPKGCSRLEDVPADLLYAISHANRILEWHENLPSDEVPPEWMWPYDRQLKKWFDEVDEERRNRYGTGSSQDDLVEVPMVQNELAEEWKKGM